jgi:hypothetical protein
MVAIGLLFLLCVFVYPLVMLRPFIKLVRQNREPLARARFSLLDLFSLMFVIQIPIALASFADARIQEIPLAMAGFMLAGAIMWFAALRALNHIGVERPIKRLVGIGYTFPAALIGGLGFPSFMTLALTQLIKLVSPSTDVIPVSNPVWIAVYLVGTLVTYKSAQWVVRGSILDRGYQVAPQADIAARHDLKSVEDLENPEFPE